ncbi:MAG: hypothetical protein GEU68_00935 [Actinobacteria bacterium]|nr:hypothetical protein [Actinomycetota bacterium]
MKQETGGGEGRAGSRAAAMAAIISIGFQTEAFVSGGGTIPAFSHEPAPNDFERLVDTVRGAIEQSGHVIAIYPDYAAEPSLARLETVRTALNTRRLATYGTSLPPLAGAALTALAAAVTPYIQAPGVLFAALPTLEEELLVLAWLGSVSKLDRPSPSLAQHLASMWPISAFGISFWPEPSVKTLRKKDRTVSLPTTFRPMMLATAAREGGDMTWVEEVVLPGLGMPPTARFDPTPLGPRWWGTTRLVEAIAYPVDVPVTARRITQNVSPFLCRWCAEAIATRHCPFCGMDAARTALVGGAA